jgi:hypothetical protein
MKKMELMEVHDCDSCHKTDWYAHHVCLKCGKEFCYDCAKTNGVHYQRGVWCGGSGDGFYCNNCNWELIGLGTDRRHNAYITIKRLAAEAVAWNKEFKARADATEAIIEEFYKNER